MSCLQTHGVATMIACYQETFCVEDSIEHGPNLQSGRVEECPSAPHAYLPALDADVSAHLNRRSIRVLVDTPTDHSLFLIWTS